MKLTRTYLTQSGFSTTEANNFIQKLKSLGCNTRNIQVMISYIDVRSGNLCNRITWQEAIKVDEAIKVLGAFVSLPTHHQRTRVDKWQKYLDMLKGIK